jgi:hypothetical protein
MRPQDLVDDRYGPNTALVQHFLERLEAMPPRGMFRAVWRWRVKIVPPRWFEAEDALGRAFTSADRYRHRKRALDQLATVFEHAAWFRAVPTFEVLGPASVPAAHYIAATALGALVARDLLRDEVFTTLYEPFAEMVPAAELEAAANTRWSPVSH